MSTKLQIILEAAQYEQDLAKVIAATRKAAEQMSAAVNAPQTVSVSADTAPAETAINDIPQAVDQQFTVTADAEQAERALSDLLALHSLGDGGSDLSVSVTADTDPAIKAINDIPQAPDQTITVTADTDPAIKAINDIPQAVDQQFTITADVSQPKKALADIDVSFLKKSLDDAKAPAKNFSSLIRECWKEMTNLNGGAKQFVKSMLAGGGLIGIVLAGVASVIKLCTAAYDAMVQRGKEAADAHRATADELGRAAAQTDRLKASTTDIISQLSSLASAEKLSNAEREKAVSLVAQLTRQYGELGVSVDDTTGRINNLGSAIVAIQEKNSRRKIRSIEAQLKELRDAMNQENRNVGNAGYNVGKINKTMNWFSLGGIISNLTGLTDKTNAAFGLDETQIGGEQAAKEAAERIKETDKKIRELETQRQEEQKRLAEIAKKQLEETRIQTAALAEQKIEREKQAKYRSADAEYNRMKYAEDKIANRRALIGGEQADNAKLRERTAAAQANMAQYAPGAQNADPQKYADAQKAYLQAAAEQAKSDEKIAGWQNQIKQLEYERAEAKKNMLEQAQFEVEYNKLILAGEFEKAAALKLQYELKQKNMKMTEAEKQAYLETQKEKARQTAGKMVDDAKEQVELNRMLLNGDYEAYEAEKLRIEAKQKRLQLTKEESEEIRKQRELLKQQKLQASNRDKAQDLKWQFMEKTGRGKEASEQRALRDAERTKGSKLTDKEIDATKRLHELTWELDNRRGPDFGDLSIKTNDLTQRGGFQGGAVAPDKDKYNAQIAAENKAMHTILERIERMVGEFGKF